MIRPDIRAKHASAKHSSAKDDLVRIEPESSCAIPINPLWIRQYVKSLRFFLLKPHKPTPVSRHVHVPANLKFKFIERNPDKRLSGLGALN